MSDLKYKIGDVVVIKPLDWYETNAGKNGIIELSHNYYFDECMSEYCGEEMTIKEVMPHCYYMYEDCEMNAWTDDMIEHKIMYECAKNINYKVGDKVLIKSLEWYNANKDEDGYVGDFCPRMAQYCYNVLTISRLVGGYYETNEAVCLEDNSKFLFTDDMIIGAIKNCNEIVINNSNDITTIKTTNNNKPEDAYIKFKEGDKVLCKDGCPGIVETVYVKDDGVSYGVSFGYGIDFGVYRNSELTPMPEPKQPDYKELRLDPSDDDKLATEVTGKDYKLIPPDGYLIGKVTNVNNGMLVEYVKKKPNLPTTYKECCKILNLPELELVYDTDYSTLNLSTYEWKKLNAYNALHKLRVCRDAYWRIAGEQMRLGKPWTPEDSDYITERYCIFVHKNNLLCDTPAEDCVLTFPTAEMRDFFYGCFLLTIEQAKELL